MKIKTLGLMIILLLALLITAGVALAQEPTEEAPLAPVLEVTPEVVDTTITVEDGGVIVVSPDENTEQAPIIIQENNNDVQWAVGGVIIVVLIGAGVYGGRELMRLLAGLVPKEYVDSVVKPLQILHDSAEYVAAESAELLAAFKSQDAGELATEITKGEKDVLVPAGVTGRELLRQLQIQIE